MSKPIYLVLIAIVGWSLSRPIPAQASPSFDCRAAKTLTETTICTNNDLGILDKKIADAYEHLSQDWTDNRHNSLISGQKTWLHLRDKACEPPAHDTQHSWASSARCLKAVMSHRLMQLEASVKNSENEVTFLQPLELKDFPYRDHIVNPDIESLLDLPLEPSDDDLTVRYYISDQDSPQTTIHTCREWEVYTQADWNAGGLYPASVEASFESRMGSICGLIEMLRLTHPVKRSFIPASESLIDIKKYAASFFDQPWGATQDYTIPPPTADAETLGDYIERKKIKVITGSPGVGYSSQPDDEIWIVKPRHKLGVTFIYNQAEVSLSPIMQAAFDSSGLDEVLLAWSSAMGNSGRFGGYKRVTVLKDGGPIVEIPEK